MSINKRGRKPKVEFEEQKKKYEEHLNDILDEKGKIKPATAEIFTIISNELKNRMTPKAIQIAITKNATFFLVKIIKRTKRMKLIVTILNKLIVMMIMNRCILFIQTCRVYQCLFH